MRIALLAVGFFAGMWLHEAGLLTPERTASPYELTNIRHTIETEACDRVRLDVRIVKSDVAAVFKPVLVCDDGASIGNLPLLTLDRISFPVSPCADSSAGCAGGL